MARPHRHFPTFYMHDGQNLFDAHTAFGGIPWGIGEVAAREVREDRIEPPIIVGIANSRTAYTNTARRDAAFPQSDLSLAYGRLLVEEVKPFIDTTYRTRPEPGHTAVGGSSMGGLISLHL